MNASDRYRGDAEQRDILGRAILESTVDFVILATDRNGLLTDCNEGARRILGWGEAEIRNQSIGLIFTEEDRASGIAESDMAKAVATGEAIAERWQLRKDGTRFWAHSRVTPLRAQDGCASGFLHILTDLTERLRAEEALRESDASRELALHIADLGRWDHDWADGGRTYDARARAIMGFDAADPVSPASAQAMIHPLDRERIMEAIRRAADAEHTGPYAEEYRIIKADTGEERWVSTRGRTFFEQGRCVRFAGVMADITDRKRTEQELRDSQEALRIANATLEQRIEKRTRELQTAEAALRQSQKMEAIGQLTGGIAHDFNNLLTGIIGSLDLMRRRISEGNMGDLGRFMDAASISANRAASLTHRLLAFARRQPLAPIPVNVNILVRSMEDLLLRTLGEQIELIVTADPDLWLARTDTNQLESALLNLGINARDAMPDGGRLTIETRNSRLDQSNPDITDGLECGDYVMISVSDTGTGMPPEVLAKAFDPFFTTKAIGQGTGLGLSMIYGFARQSGGHVRLSSEVGQGTTVRLYLPRHSGEAAMPEKQLAETMYRGDGQTILIVEDDPSVRLLMSELLDDLGYKPVEAGDAQTAITILESERAIAMMVSDVGLPGMNGRQLADLARQLRPDLPVLFVTGYAEKAALRENFLGAGMDMMTKPFAMKTLASRVHQMIRPDAIIQAD